MTEGLSMPVFVEHRDGMAVVMLNRPDAMNALTVPMLVELGDQLSDVADDASVRVVILTGSGRAFCSGVDLKVLAELELDQGRVGDDFDAAARRVTDLLSTMPKPTIAAVNGACFTGGLELALACDLVIAANEALLGDTHARWGLRPTWGMTQRLPRAVGMPMARLMSYTARSITGVEAAAFGLAAEAVPRAELMQHVEALAQEIMGNSSPALAAYKDLYRVAEDGGLEAGLDTEVRRNYPISGSASLIENFTKKRGGIAAPDTSTDAVKK